MLRLLRLLRALHLLALALLSTLPLCSLSCHPSTQQELLDCLRQWKALERRIGALPEPLAETFRLTKEETPALTQVPFEPAESMLRGAQRWQPACGQPGWHASRARTPTGVCLASHPTNRSGCARWTGAPRRTARSCWAPGGTASTPGTSELEREGCLGSGQGQPPSVAGRPAVGPAHRPAATEHRAPLLHVTLPLCGAGSPPTPTWAWGRSCSWRWLTKSRAGALEGQRERGRGRSGHRLARAAAQPCAPLTLPCPLASLPPSVPRPLSHPQRQGPRDARAARAHDGAHPAAGAAAQG